jgi:hypothetical protein
MDLKEAVEQYKDQSEALDAAKGELKRLKEIFDNQNDVIYKIIENHSENCKNLKDEIQKLGKEEFEKTGNKKLFGGIGIQERKSIVYDEKKAFEFAKEKDMFLSLDKKSFETAAKSLNLDFVKEEKEIKVTIPKEIKL